MLDRSSSSAGASKSSSSSTRRRAVSSDGARSSKRARAFSLSAGLRRGEEGDVEDPPGLVGSSSSDESDSEGVPPSPLDEDAEVLSEIFISTFAYLNKNYCPDGKVRY